MPSRTGAAPGQQQPTTTALGRLKICQLNCRSVNNIIDELKHFLAAQKVNVMVLNETWLRPDMYFHVPGYITYRRDRVGLRGGGVAILVHEQLKARKLPEKGEEEILAVKIVGVLTGGEDLVVATYYKAPRTTISKPVLTRLLCSHKNTLFIGDLNARNELWSQRGSTCPSGAVIEELLDEEELTLLNTDEATFAPQASSVRSILDLAICSPDLLPSFHRFSVTDELRSDHLTVQVEINIPAVEVRSTTIRSINWDKLYGLLGESDCLVTGPIPVNKEAIKSRAAKLEEVITCAINGATSTRTIKVDPAKFNRLPPWIVELIKKRRRIQSYTDPATKNEANRLRRQIRQAIDEFKAKKWESRCTKLNAMSTSDSKFWKELKKIEAIGEPVTAKTPTLVEGADTTNDAAKCGEIFGRTMKNNFSEPTDPKFDHAFKEEVDRAQSTLFNNQLPPPAGAPTAAVSAAEIATILKKIRSDGAPGHDGITNRVLKILPDEYHQVLADIASVSLQLAYIPPEWKKATVVMIPKPLMDHSLPENQRPICLLLTLSKVLERVVQTRLQDWLDREHILSPFQSGFRKDRQTRDHMLRLIQHGQQAFNNGQLMGAMFVDIEKAFDKVWHQGLLYRLDQLKVPDYLGHWIRDYLSGRKFRVRVDGHLSSEQDITAGVPQGSVLGPILFCIFFDSIHEAIGGVCEPATYADDLSIWTSDEDLNKIEERLQTAADRLAIWMNKWRTKVSKNKTNVTVFKPHQGTQATIQVRYDGELLEQELNPKFLGLTLDPCLKMNVHVRNIEVRTARRLAMLRSLSGKRWGMSQRLKLITYKALIRPIIDYVPFVPITTADTNYMVLERIQRAAARIITRTPLSRRVNTEVIYQQIGLESIKTRAFKLARGYLTKAFKTNVVIRTLVKLYNNNREYMEGVNSGFRTRTTLLGHLLQLQQ